MSIGLRLHDRQLQMRTSEGLVGRVACLSFLEKVTQSAVTNKTRLDQISAACLGPTLGTLRHTGISTTGHHQGSFCTFLSLTFWQFQGGRGSGLVEFTRFWNINGDCQHWLMFFPNGWFYRKGLRCYRPLIFPFFLHENSKRTAILRPPNRKKLSSICSEKTALVFKE